MWQSKWQWSLALAGIAVWYAPGLAQDPLPRINVEVIAHAETPYWIGVAIHEADPALLAQLGVEHGVVVEDVAPESPAAKAGLKRHDLITKAGEKAIATGTDLQTAIGEAKDSELNLTVVRSGKEETLQVTPIRRPEDRFAPPGVAAPLARLPARLMQEFKGSGPIELDMVGPGIMLNSKPLVLPEGVKMIVEREGSKPATLTVKRGEESWTVAEDKLDELPEDLRGPARAMLGLPPQHVIQQVVPLPQLGPGGVAPRIRMREFREDPFARIEEQLRELRTQVEELRGRVRE